MDLAHGKVRETNVEVMISLEDRFMNGLVVGSPGVRG